MSRPSLLELYHRVPYPAKVAIASVRGASLQRWRYGRDTGGLVAEALRREAWSAEEWQAWQETRVRDVLTRAADAVPAYRDAGVVPGEISCLEAWPLLRKSRLRADPAAFVAEDRNRRRMFEDHTSGTTGTPVIVWLSKQAVRSWYGLFEARVRVWNGVDRHDRWGIVGGQLVVPVDRDRPPFWVWNAASRQLYLSAFHISDGHAAAYAAAMREHRLRYLLGYPSALSSLALAIEAAGATPPELEVVATNAEPLTDGQRRTIERVFRCPVRNTYGMSEAVAAGSECEAGTMHMWPEAGVIEVLHDDRDEPVAAGEVGRLVATGLLNPDMPLIRYETGDRGAVRWDLECGCGRALPAFTSVEGRMDDLVVTADGRSIGRLDGIFKADLPIREAQIVQEELDRFKVLVVPAPAFDEGARRAIAERLIERVGAVEVEVVDVDRIPRTANGKFRAVVSNVGRR